MPPVIRPEEKGRVTHLAASQGANYAGTSGTFGIIGNPSLASETKAEFGNEGKLASRFRAVPFAFRDSSRVERIWSFASPSVSLISARLGSRLTEANPIVGPFAVSVLVRGKGVRMTLQPSRKLTAFVLICSIWLLPVEPVLAARTRGTGQAAPTNPKAAVVVRDVALQAGGVLRGQVVDKQGQPCAGVPVTVTKTGVANAAPVAARTDDAGRFQCPDLTGGVYFVETADGGAICRLWAPNTAPPAAVPAALVVQGQGPVRANLANLSPWGWTLIGLGVAAAIAIPLILSQDDDDGS